LGILKPYKPVAAQEFTWINEKSWWLTTTRGCGK
jgi:hypothetical protein